jgi:hypothetical protein
MIAVSNGWKAMQNQTLLPEMFVEITCSLTEPGLENEATVSADNPEDFADVQQIVSRVAKNSEPYATLDYGCWGLDGSFGYADGTPDDPGYVSKIHSNADGTLTGHPKITIDFSDRKDIAIPGLMITWSKVFGSWATEFKITASNSSGVVAQKVVTGNTSPVSMIMLDMVDYSKITIEIMKWSHPYQRVRCIDLRFGVERIYDKTDLLGYEHKQSVDLLSAALPQNTITFRLRNDDNRWNPDNPKGVEKYLIEQQEMKVRYGMDVNGTIEWIPGGTFWLSEWDTPANGMEAVFTARDAIGFMEIAYTGPRSGTLYDIAIAALTEADLPLLEDGSDRYIVDEVLREIPTDFTGDNEYTVSEILQMIAHAGGCVFYQDRNGVIHIERWKKNYSDYIIEPSISYSHPEYTINKPMKALSVGYGNDNQRAVVTVASRGEIQTIDNPLITTEADAIRVGEIAKEILENRKVVSGEFRADLRMDVLDGVIVTSKYASNIVGITDITYSTKGGAFRGTYTGRSISVSFDSSNYYSNEIYLGEV